MFEAAVGINWSLVVLTWYPPPTLPLQPHTSTQPAPSMGFRRMNSPRRQSKEGHPLHGEPQEHIQAEAEDDVWMPTRVSNAMESKDPWASSEIVGGKAPCKFMELEPMFSHLMSDMISSLDWCDSQIWRVFMGFLFCSGNLNTIVNPSVPNKVMCSYLGRELDLKRLQRRLKGFSRVIMPVHQLLCCGNWNSV